MTKKDYIKIAECIKTELDFGVIDKTATSVVLRSLQYRIADVFAADNPNFNCDKFEKACGF